MIPLATVVMEELAFRGVLLGLLRRIVDDRRALLVSSAAVRPVAHPRHARRWSGRGDRDRARGTAVPWIAFGWLRLGSDSLVAPVLADVATNSVTFVLAWVIAP